MSGYDAMRAVAGSAESLIWTGRSGRRYLMARVEGERAEMTPARLYALAEDGVIRWAGTAEDLIADHVSRERFRRASTDGAQLLSMPASDDPLAVMTLVWDLEGTHHQSGRVAA